MDRPLFQKRKRDKEANGFINDSYDDAADPNGIGLRTQGDRPGDAGFVSENHKGDDWETFPTQSPICSRDDGLSYRLDGITFSKWRQESIKGYGNAVVPQLVYRIFDTIQQYENL